MTKGIRMVCQHCNREQDVTELCANDVLGVDFITAKRFLAQYRELVDPRQIYLHRLKASQEIAGTMIVYLQRIADSHDCCKLMYEIRKFVKSIIGKTRRSKP